MTVLRNALVFILTLFLASNLVLAGENIVYTKVTFPEYKTFELSNGIKALTMLWNGGNLGTIEVKLPAGSATDPKGKEGLAYLASKLLALGTKRHTGMEVIKRLEELGATFHTSVDRDAFNISLSTIAPSMDETMGLFKEIIQEPVFSQDNFERQKQVQLTELAYNMANPSWVAKSSFYRLFYEGHPYAHSFIGTKEGINSLTAEDVQQFYYSYLKASCDVVVVEVAPRPLEDQEDIIRRVFEDWGKRQPAHISNELQEFKPGPSRFFIVPYPDSNQAQIVLGHEGIRINNPDRFKISVMNYILGGGAFSSRLFEKVRIEKGLTYSIRSGFDPYKEKGPFVISTFTRTSEAANVISLVKSEIASLKENSATDSELDDAKSYLILSYPLAIQTSSSVAARFSDYLFYGLSLGDMLNYQDKIYEVTKDDTFAMAKEYLYPDRLNGVVVGNQDVLKEILYSLNPKIMDE